MNPNLSMQTKARRRQRGSFILEFALVAPLILMMLAVTFELGIMLNRSITAEEVSRNANVLVVRGIDLSQSGNQQLLMRTSAGLGIADSNWNPSPTGKGVVILSKVVLVGDLTCGTGVPNYDGTSATCPNLGSYVIASRINIGNTSTYTSPIGNPSSTLNSDGSVSASDIATKTGDRANGFPGIITLSSDGYTNVAEIFVDVSGLQLFSIAKPQFVYWRNLS